MASIPGIYSLPDTIFPNLGGSCSDQELMSALAKYQAELERSLLDSPRRISYSDVMEDTRLASLPDRPRSAIYRELLASYIDFLCFPTEKLLLMDHLDVTEGLKTDHGTWWPKKLVSIRNTSQGNSPNSPKFVGAKTTMEFKPTDGSKAVVGMTRYNLLTTREDGDGLDLDEELSLCHVFPLEGKGKGTRNRNGKRSRSEDALDPRKGITTAELEELERIGSEIDSTEHPPLAVDDSSVNVQDLLCTDPSKSEPSKFWQSFTKIHTRNPKLTYAACNHCDTMLKLKGGPSCGTSSLRHHNDSCRCKPKQEQLPGNSSSMPIPSIALQAITE